MFGYISGDASRVADREQGAIAGPLLSVLQALRREMRQRTGVVDGVFMLIVFALALLVRVHDLGRQSLWLDEATQVWSSALPVRTILARLAQSDTQPPLYYIALHGWMVVFGRSVVDVRFLSAVTGALAPPLLYAVGRTLAGRWVAALAALLLIANPFHIWYSQETRSYALMATLALAAAWLLLRWVGSARPLWGILLALANALLLYTQSTTVLFVAAQVGYVVVTTGPRPLSSARMTRSIRLLWPFVGALALWLPWVPTTLAQMGRGQTNWIPYATGGDAWTFLRALTGLDTGLGQVQPDLLHQIVAGLLLAVAVASLRVGWREALLFMGPAVLLFAFSTHLHLWAPRAVLFAAAGMAVLVARGLARLPRPAGLAALILIAGLGALAPTPTKEPWGGLAAALCANARPGDVVYAEPDYALAPLAYYTMTRPCPPLILSPLQPLPTTPAAFLAHVFTRQGVEARAAAWLSGGGGPAEQVVYRQLVAQRARIWFVCRDQGPACPGPQGTTFRVQPVQRALFQWQGELILTSARIGSSRSP